MLRCVVFPKGKTDVDNLRDISASVYINSFAFMSNSCEYFVSIQPFTILCITFSVTFISLNDGAIK